MPTLFAMTRDINGYNGFGLPFSINKYSATLTTGAEQTFTVPSETRNYIVIFSFEPGARVWVAKNETAAVPAGATVVSTTSELNPTARQVLGGDVLHFITPDVTADMGITLYAL